MVTAPKVLVLHRDDTASLPRRVDEVRRCLCAIITAMTSYSESGEPLTGGSSGRHPGVRVGLGATGHQWPCGTHVIWRDLHFVLAQLATI